MLLQNPEVRHGTIKMGFTPDEEIGRGANLFDVEKFGAQFAYTMDGGPLGEIEYETFNAFSAHVTFTGVGVHPGYAKGKLVNATRVLAAFIDRLPRNVSPEATEDREGYIHPYTLSGTSEQITVKILLRDFEMDGIAEKKALINLIAEEVREAYPKATIDVEYIEYYRNMRYKIEEEPRLIAYAEEAIKRCDVEPHHELIRGGTDGARLSYMGLPCPNLFAGGEAIHSEREWVPVQVMEKAAETIVRLSEIWAEKSLG